VSEVCVYPEDKQLPGSPLYQQAFRRGDVIQVAPDGYFWGKKVMTHPTWIIFKVPGSPEADWMDMMVSVYDTPPETPPGELVLLRAKYFDLNTLAYVRGASPFVAMSGTALEAAKRTYPEALALGY
jgi:hypothetical protein